MSPLRTGAAGDGGTRASASRYLAGAGTHAEIAPDPLIDGAFVLSIGGAEQSHVDLARPDHVFYAYLRRMANVLDLLAPPGAPLRVLHLGAGALTLVRYVEATRPGSRQAAVELERELLGFVLERLPLPIGTQLAVRIGDARGELPAFSGEPRFDAVVLDVFSGPEAPAHIAHRDFYAECAALLSPRGAMLVNIGDDPPLTLVRSQLAAMRTVFREVAALSEPEMFEARYPGNIVAVGLSAPWPDGWSEALAAAGPHPTALRRGVDLDGLAGGTGGS
ncbi:fused MFS/spermidine synthase [Sinomonas sp. JGH33]|uniref:Fused MFS/spermidine synthase n=1 Tax=Sinomonas terricola TaxID=3110330 RepID=A0ABU5TBV8_9MICC|nr:fused MFS/spermidine synthase [Sinomonas sp. JGH33]MEA5456576.1 fused MFS/spermidine synthase [Sinomonas sp. JGH33]